MGRRRSVRKGALDWWQAVIDETKDFVDDGIDRLRDDDDDDELAHEVTELKRAIARMSDQVDSMMAGAPARAKSTS